MVSLTWVEVLNSKNFLKNRNINSQLFIIVEEKRRINFEMHSKEEFLFVILSVTYPKWKVSWMQIRTDNDFLLSKEILNKHLSNRRGERRILFFANSSVLLASKIMIVEFKILYFYLNEGKILIKLPNLFTIFFRNLRKIHKISSFFVFYSLN